MQCAINAKNQLHNKMLNGEILKVQYGKSKTNTTEYYGQPTGYNENPQFSPIYTSNTNDASNNINNGANGSSNSSAIIDIGDSVLGKYLSMNNNFNRNPSFLNNYPQSKPQQFPKAH